ncbi:UDP-glycosyltransferase UGT4-like [Anthonomus grandis grandis]|uniref:UDP-glycosyltransferase UGT4-like n=1 Tax=Anthonomus grandis grandis TaxID=2921223 RepID=UPI002166316C|nr:UDP-glycosyltransferase UGT4-like [Anthonomus grandis grandis]
MWLIKTILIHCAILLCKPANGARILGIFMTPSYSHQIVFQPIWRELSLRGHEVTVYTPSPLNDPSLTNLTEYDLGFSFKQMQDKEKAAFDASKWFDIFLKVSEAQLNHPYMQDLINNVDNKTYDLLLVEYLWQPFYAFKEIYKVPMVGITSLPLSLGNSDALGIEKHPVVDPDLLLQFSRAENLQQRVISWLHNWLYRLVASVKFKPIFNKQMEKYFKGVTKTCWDLAKEVALVIGNYNFALQNVRPITPNFVTISAIHVKPQKPLPEDLGNLLDNLQNDVIYFSLGTNVRPSALAQVQLNKLLDTLGQLPYTILYKSDLEDSHIKLPKNFYTSKWFPQQDVLGHPKVKLFITQGGMQSIDEALSRKVPMLVIPFIADQKTNSEKCVKLGIAESIDFNNFTPEELTTKIQKLITEKSYRENIERQSNIVNDQPTSSLDKAIFWIEYVLRHEGASHLRYEASDLPFYHYYLLDVYFSIACLLFTIYLSGRWIMKKVLSSFVIKSQMKNKDL